MTAIAVDIGGTFTDLVVRDAAGTITAHKSSTTPDEFSRGIGDVLDKAGVPIEAVQVFTHGTTVALNALLERRGAATGLLTTAGFRDVLEIMRTSRPHNYDLQADKPVTLVPRFRRREVSERTDATGAILREVDEAEVLEQVAELVADGCDSLAICFLFAFRNPANEERAAAAVRRAFPELTVSTSSEITREWREFERTSTTVVNALCRPAVERYVDGLERRMTGGGYRGTIRYMQSNGGLMSATDARRFPVRTLLSGPVGGVIAAEWFAQLLGEPDIITLDIGGTSADMALVRNGHADVRADKDIERWPILFSAVDIHAVGAGGGSIAAVDEYGALHVGPRSAGADPGPLCYGRGGTEPTVTDAHVVLGAIDPEYFLGGDLKLNAAAAADAIRGQIAQPAGLSVPAAASGIIEIVNARMFSALREVSVRRGHDPRDFALLAFGGGGGLHAAALARELGMARAIIPVNPGVFSAMGMLAAQVKYDFAQTVLVSLSQARPQDLADVYAGLEERCRAQLDAAGVDQPGARVLWSVDARYAGQDHTLLVAVADRTLDAVALARLGEAFEAEHERQFGYRLDDDVVLVHMRVTVISSSPPPQLAEVSQGGTGAPVGEREIVLRHDGSTATAAVYRRADLSVGAIVHGPALVEEAQSTVLVGPGDVLTMERHGSLVIDVTGDAA